MNLAKNASIVVLALGLAAAGCTGTRYHRDFPPRVDHYIADEFSHSAKGLADSGSMFLEMTGRDASNTAALLTDGIPSYLGHELGQKSQDMGSSLADFGSREWDHAKNFPAAVWDFLELLFGI